MGGVVDNLWIKLLGPVAVYRDTVEIPVGPPRQRAILAVLALQPGQPVPLDAITEAVWGNNPPASGVHLARSYVARLRQALEPDAAPWARTNVIASVPGGYRLDIPATQVDVAKFRCLVDRACRRQAAGALPQAFELLEEALALWQDPSLTDLGALLACPRHLAALRQDWVVAGVRYVAVGLSLGLASMVLPTAERLAAAEPLQEAVQARYLEALTRSGQRAAAIHHYHAVRGRLRQELGVEPGAELRRMYAALLRAEDEPRPSPPPAAESIVVEAGRAFGWRGPRPAVGPLIGRDDDVARCAALLVAHRHVTIVGPPGCGKSAAGLAVAERVADAFPDGVAIVDAAAARDRSDVLRLMVHTIDVSPSDADPLRVIGDQRMLLVLNDVEHLGGLVGELVARVLHRCPRVAVLVTSRRRLGLPHEAVFRLAPLPLPELAQPDRIRDNPAVRLFAYRATLVRPDFRLSETTTLAVGRICCALDGLPLAIEHAAACLYTDSLDGVLRRVADPLHELRPQRRGYPPHHRSLYAALHRSLAALPQVDRACLARLGGQGESFSLPEAIARCADLASPAQLGPVLDRLTDESLLEPEPGGNGPRYRILRTVALAAAVVTESEASGARQAFHGITGNQP